MRCGLLEYWKVYDLRNNLVFPKGSLEETSDCASSIGKTLMHARDRLHMLVLVMRGIENVSGDVIEMKGDCCETEFG